MSGSPTTRWCAGPKTRRETRYWYYALHTCGLNDHRAGSGQPLLNQAILRDVSGSDGRGARSGSGSPSCSAPSTTRSPPTTRDRGRREPDGRHRPSRSPITCRCRRLATRSTVLRRTRTNSTTWSRISASRRSTTAPNPSWSRRDPCRSGKFCVVGAVRVVRQAESPDSAHLECGAAAAEMAVGEHRIRRAEADWRRHLGAVVGGTQPDVSDNVAAAGRRNLGQPPADPPRDLLDVRVRDVRRLAPTAAADDHQPGCAVSRATHRIRCGCRRFRDAAAAAADIG